MFPPNSVCENDAENVAVVRVNSSRILKIRNHFESAYRSIRIVGRIERNRSNDSRNRRFVDELLTTEHLQICLSLIHSHEHTSFIFLSFEVSSHAAAR